MKDRRPLSLAERLEVEAALDAAFAPLRAWRSDLSAARVRAAVRWGRGAPRAPVPWAAAVARLSELSVAVGMSVMVFVGAFGPDAGARPAPTPAASGLEADVYAVPRVTAPLEDESYIRWLRLDRYVPLQDWLDPSVVRAGTPARGVRLELPAPPVGTASDRTPY